MARKTTLIKLISKLLSINSGSIQMPESYKISYVSSNERSFFGRMTGYQNLDFFLSLMIKKYKTRSIFNKL